MKKIKEVDLTNTEPWTVLSGEKGEFIIVLPDGKTVSIETETVKWLRAQLNSIR